ncbi:DUF3263 domain-containing protein [Microbacterium allomyrinae]|uniref:DUF3263 domain-containing protein n=1 Tax=Microbacterium allomyrinae TaxID=2830666 RepID=A0A9X1LTQ5_9MICO|nr:DUF3263 domain-containing protein [Microbacterium allomyrinae]MCC2031809.1 DUF3263 domain-containing protein [Microbacterium allomyrinae]
MTGEAKPRPTGEQLLAFEAKHPKATGRKETAILDELGIRPARYYQLLGRLIKTEDALRIDPMLTNRLRARSMKQQTEQKRRAHRGR